MFFRRKKKLKTLPQVTVNIKNNTNRTYKKDWEDNRHMIWAFPEEIPAYGEITANFKFIDDPSIDKTKYYGRTRYITVDFQDIQVEAFWGEVKISYYEEKTTVEPAGILPIIGEEYTINIEINEKA